ncbi:MAG: hypothetical protein ACJA0E_001937 [Bermanella sp.]|jgi:hypothetical protein
MSTTIAKASVLISELVDVIESLYWEASSMIIKNQCFNVVRILQQEITELTKVSVQDHHYEYETIACPGKKLAADLERLSSLIEAEVLRTQTEDVLVPLLAEAKSVFK